ncbi:sugar ABC transporter ATP-binding protein [Streptomyces sp. NBC_01278]|uniref:sugar ABC transporter ATP-binding protein n=1 Tax=unclassified Streptomyces TaxID=2593676 RepID=UPI002E302661|nr:sugar ABC transporter ATP-binding protein [Streptomyces sp. NBC_01278]
MTATGLRVAGVAKSFAGVLALRDISLDFPAGSVTALMGENGAGKSTLLKIVCGDHPADCGTVHVDGAEVRLRSPADARAAGIRLIPQEPEIVPHLTVAENVYLGALPTRGGRRFDRAALRRRLREDLDRIGFGHVLDADTPGILLTPAQRQLVEILRALTGEAKVVAFDEPTSSLSEHEVEALFALIRRLREQGLAVVYVSHRMQEIFRLADRVAVLRDGVLVGVEDAAATDEGAIVRMMVGRDLSVARRGPARTHAAGDRGVVLDVREVTTDDVRAITFQVRAGEVVALAGLVGAGRSELARALIGDLPLRGGTVSVLGEELRLRRPSDAIRAGIGLAPEERKAQALFLDRSVRDNIALAVLDRLSRLRFVRRAAEKELARKYTGLLRVRTPSVEREVRTLSGGNQQKVVLARWLARRPKVLILDEPTRGIDVGAKAEIHRIIADLAEAGVALLVISSELPEVLGLADRVLVMQGGRITGELDRAEATEEAVLALAMAEDLTTTTGSGGAR